MKFIIAPIFIILFTTSTLKSQGIILLYENYNETTSEFSTPRKAFSKSKGLWYKYTELTKDKIGEFSLWIRIVIIKNYSEELYNSYKIDIDPEWTETWDHLFLPIGMYKVKIYTEDKKLLDESFEFGVE